MAITILLETALLKGETEIIWPGDAVFCYDPAIERRFPLHVGVFIGIEQEVSPQSREVEVRGIPDKPYTLLLGESVWGGVGRYHADVIGRRRDFGRPAIHDVALLSEAVATEHSLIGKCKWNSKMELDYGRPIRDGIPRFVKGTCTHFVEYLYEYSYAELNLVDQYQPLRGADKGSTYDPEHPNKIYPATQMHAFWRGSYPLRITPWDKRLGKPDKSYDECLFGTRNTEA